MEAGKRSTRTRRALGDISNQTEAASTAQTAKPAPKKRVRLV